MFTYLVGLVSLGGSDADIKKAEKAIATRSSNGTSRVDDKDRVKRLAKLRKTLDARTSAEDKLREATSKIDKEIANLIKAGGKAKTAEAKKKAKDAVTKARIAKTKTLKPLRTKLENAALAHNQAAVNNKMGQTRGKKGNKETTSKLSPTTKGPVQKGAPLRKAPMKEVKRSNRDTKAKSRQKPKTVAPKAASKKTTTKKK